MRYAHEYLQPWPISFCGGSEDDQIVNLLTVSFTTTSSVLLFELIHNGENSGLGLISLSYKIDCAPFLISGEYFLDDYRFWEQDVSGWVFDDKIHNRENSLHECGAFGEFLHSDGNPIFKQFVLSTDYCFAQVTSQMSLMAVLSLQKELFPWLRMIWAHFV